MITNETEKGVCLSHISVAFFKLLVYTVTRKEEEMIIILLLLTRQFIVYFSEPGIFT